MLNLVIFSIEQQQSEYRLLVQFYIFLRLSRQVEKDASNDFILWEDSKDDTVLAELLADDHLVKIQKFIKHKQSQRCQCKTGPEETVPITFDSIKIPSRTICDEKTASPWQRCLVGHRLLHC